MPIPILDNHIHLEPFRGRNVDAVRDFERQGGTHLIISHLPYEEISTMEMSADYVRENKALAIGEVGRPHFPVSTEIWNASNELMLLAMALAKEAQCAIVLHTEHVTPDNMREFASMAEQAGLPRDRGVKHYSPPPLHPQENFGLMACG